MDSQTILYVEDEEDIRIELVEILEMDYNNIIVASNGKEGLELFELHHPDLIISDIQMPHMDGITMSKMIREVDKSTPIIFTSAFNEVDYRRKADEINNVSFVTKPIKINELFTVIKGYFNEQRDD